jgi:hypothetical protein
MNIELVKKVALVVVAIVTALEEVNK